jgi:hypothetical protein
VRFDPSQRYEELTEFIYDLENPNPEYLAPASTKVIGAPKRNGWKALALALMITQAISAYFLLRELRTAPPGTHEADRGASGRT